MDGWAGLQPNEQPSAEVALGEAGNFGGDGFVYPVFREIHLIGRDLKRLGDLVDGPFLDDVQVVNLVLPG